MSKKETAKYLIPVEIVKYHPHKWLDIKTYDYKLYADTSEEKFTRIRFIDFNGFTIGEHMPVNLKSLYSKAATQVQNNAIKAVSEIRNAVVGAAGTAAVVGNTVASGVSTVANGVFDSVKDDAIKTAMQTAGIANHLYGKLTSYTKKKFAKEEPIRVEVVTNELPVETVVDVVAETKISDQP